MSEITIERFTRVTKQDHSDLAKLFSDIELSEEVLEQALDDKNMHVFVGREDKNIVGIGMLVIMHVFSERRARIEDVVVDEKYQETDIGKQIMDYLILAARGRGLDAIELSADPQNEYLETLSKEQGFKKEKHAVYRLDL